MPNGLPDNSQEVSVEGQGIILDFVRTSPTTGTLTWVIPSSPKAYNGILLTGAIKEINPSNYPTDSVVYTGSSNFASPVSMIGNANVVGAFYNDLITKTISITGLATDQVYFFSAHLITNVNTYWATGVRSYPEQGTSTAFAGSMPANYGPPANPVVGQVYYDENQKLVFFWSGTAWSPTSSHTVISDTFDPVAPFTTYYPLNPNYPQIGDFFYNTQQKMLKYWNGTTWIATEDSVGQPMYNKSGVGTDNTYTARANLIDILKKQFGWPVVCVELIEDHFNVAIDNALQEIRRRTDIAYYKQYFFMTTNKFQDVYYLNDRSVGTDKIVDVIKIHRLNMMGIQNFTQDNILAQQFLQQFYAPNVQADLVSIHLIASMSEVYDQMFAGDVAFNWRESVRQLHIYRKLGGTEKVLLETSCEKLEQEILQDRWMQQWVQAWAQSEAMLILAQIRGKFASLPGPGGGLQLNAETLISQGQAIQEDCLRQIKDMEVGQNGPDNWYAPFIIG
jgi:hypothetical protein